MYTHLSSLRLRHTSALTCRTLGQGRDRGAQRKPTDMGTTCEVDTDGGPGQKWLLVHLLLSSSMVEQSGIIPGPAESSVTAFPPFSLNTRSLPNDPKWLWSSALAGGVLQGCGRLLTVSLSQTRPTKGLVCGVGPLSSPDLSGSLLGDEGWLLGEPV